MTWVCHEHWCAHAAFPLVVHLTFVSNRYILYMLLNVYLSQILIEMAHAYAARGNVPVTTASKTNNKQTDIQVHASNINDNNKK